MKHNTTAAVIHPVTKEPIKDVRVSHSNLGPGDIVNLSNIPADTSRYGVVRMVRNADGSYTPLIKTYTRWMRLNATTLIELNLHGALSRDTIQRLIDCGIIKTSMPSPQVTLIDVDSLLTHLENTRTPGWWTEERRKAFRLGLPIK
jgi:hypothetical protein